MKTEKWTKEKLRNHVIDKLLQRGVTIKDIAEITLITQSRFAKNLTLEQCIFNVERVLDKREVLNAVITGITLDEFAEKGMLPEPLQQYIASDEGLYGIDEILVFSIVNIYGSIGWTTFGYVDQEKFGIIKELDSHKDGQVNTFLDDIVGAIASAASSRIAHRLRDKEEEE